MKKQKRLSTIIASVAMIAVTAVALGTATFAWFTQGTTASAGGFDFTAQAAAGIQISTDAKTWGSNLVASDFESQLGARTSINGLKPVSTNAKATIDGVYNFYSAEGKDGQFEISANTEDYLVFDLYFLNEGTDALTLRLASGSSVKDNTLNDKKTSLATRVAFVKQGAFDYTEASPEAIAGNVSEYIWEPNSLKRSGSALSKSAVDNAKYTYHGLTGNNGGYLVQADDYGFIASSEGVTQSVTETKDIAIGDSGNIADLEAGMITKIKIFVWLEGQDIDNANDTSGGTVDIELEFDSASEGKTVSELTANGISDDTLTVEGAAHVGATYTAYVFENSQQDNKVNALSYKKLLTTGNETATADSIETILLDDEVINESESVKVVIKGIFEGYIESITATEL